MDLLTTAAACAGALLVAGTGVAVLPWTDRERKAVLVAFATVAAIVLRGSVKRSRFVPNAGPCSLPAPLPLPARLPAGVFPWNSSCPPSIGSSPGTAGM
jgi:hypothetical protein